MPLQDEMPRVPVIDLSLFDVGGTWRDHTAAQVDEAASALGIFRVIGHGIEPAVIDSMLDASRAFFSQPGTTKVLYFREELADDDEHPHPAELQPRNVFPELPGFRDAVLDYMNALSGLAHRLMASIGRGLRLGDNYFVDRYTGRPTTLFRISRDAEESPNLGQSAEGLLTLLHQEDDGGLQVKRGSRWIDAPYVPGSIVVGIGDVLERLTSGHYISAAHRMISHSGQGCIGLPFSFGPSVDAVLRPIASLDHGSDRTLIRLASGPARRCDGAYS
jgi:isopenicillin N synthase-like dioxygenase